MGLCLPICLQSRLFCIGIARLCKFFLQHLGLFRFILRVPTDGVIQRLFVVPVSYRITKRDVISSLEDGPPWIWAVITGHMRRQQQQQQLVALSMQSYHYQPAYD